MNMRVPFVDQEAGVLEIGADAPALVLSAEQLAEIKASTERLNEKSDDARRELRAAVNGFPALEAGAEIWLTAEAEQHQLALVHNAAEIIGIEEAIEAANEVWQASLEQLGVVSRGLLTTPVSTAAEAKVKYRAIEACEGVYTGLEDDTILAQTRADLDMLAGLSAPPPSSLGGSNAELVGLSAVYQEIARARDAEDQGSRESIARAEALTGSLQPIIDRANGLVATSPAGFRAKAVIAADWAPNPDHRHFEDLEWQVHASLVRDLLASPIASDPEFSRALADYEARRREENRLLQVADDLPEGSERLEADRAWEDFSSWPSFKAMMSAPAASLSDLTAKVRHYIAEAWCTEKSDNVDSPATISRLLSEIDIEGSWGPVRIYQDLLRLTGQRPELAQVRPAEDLADDTSAEAEAPQFLHAAE